MSDLESFSPRFVRKEVGVDHLVAALRVGSAAALGASTLDPRLLPYHPVLLDSCLSDQIPKVSIPSVADYGLLCEFLAFCWIYFKVTPGFIKDFLQVRQLPVVRQDQRCSLLVRFLFIGQKGCSLCIGSPLDSSRDLTRIVSSLF